MLLCDITIRKGSLTHQPARAGDRSAKYESVAPSLGGNAAATNVVVICLLGGVGNGITTPSWFFDW
jgi:hypothetical protein